jgi:hypothetical protein
MRYTIAQVLVATAIVGLLIGAAANASRFGPLFAAPFGLLLLLAGFYVVRASRRFRTMSRGEWAYVMSIVALVCVSASVHINAIPWTPHDTTPLREFDQWIAYGMRTVDAIEQHKSTTGAYPKSLEAIDAHAPSASEDGGFFVYQRDFGGGESDKYYTLTMYFYPSRQESLAWIPSDRCWRTVGRLPKELFWTERQARALVPAKTISQQP